MSNPTRLPDPASAATPAASAAAAGIPPALLICLRVLLAAAYPFLSHRASLHGDGAWAAVAIADIVLLLLLEPLLKRRVWALLLLAACLSGLWLLSLSRYALMPLLAPPVVFLAWVAWWFARTLRAGQTPLITRIVEALNAQAGLPMTPDLARYTRLLTATWAILLGSLSLVNLVLALCAVPDGVLVQLGHRPPFAVSHEIWSWVANVLNYGAVAVLFIGEYLIRKRLFPQRPYRNFVQFVQQMGQLGPAFWSRLMR